MAFDGNPGSSALAKVLSQRMEKVGASPLVLDFGSIEADLSLKTNTFPVPIPKSDYTVCRHVGGLSIAAGGGEHEGHNSGSGSHSHEISMPKVVPGDRVLVAWVQQDAVVIDVIVSASKL